MVRVYLYRKEGFADRRWQHDMGQRILKSFSSENKEMKYSNISHSRCLVAVAFSDHPVGVDVELFRDVPDVGRKILGEDEIKWGRSISSKDWLLRMWTLKESYGKAYGVGIAYPLKETQFFWEGDTEGFIPVKCTDQNVSCYNMKGDDFSLSVCLVGEETHPPELLLLQNDISIMT